MPPAVMAIWSGSEEGFATSIATSVFCLLRISRASATQFIVTGWREGRIPVADLTESPFFFFGDEGDESSAFAKPEPAANETSCRAGGRSVGQNAAAPEIRKRKNSIRKNIRVVNTIVVMLDGARYWGWC